MAHEPEQTGCVAPVRPLDERDEGSWQQFLVAIDHYRACVNAQRLWHQAAADAHAADAERAVMQWNDFVRTSLNAPEDFPWPQ